MPPLPNVPIQTSQSMKTLPTIPSGGSYSPTMGGSHRGTVIGSSTTVGSPSSQSSKNLSSQPSLSCPPSTSGPPSSMTTEELVQRVNVLQTQLFLVTKEKQKLAYQNQLLSQENEQLQETIQKLTGQLNKSSSSSRNEKIDQLVCKFEKTQEQNVQQQRQLTNLMSALTSSTNGSSPSMIKVS